MIAFDIFSVEGKMIDDVDFAVDLTDPYLVSHFKKSFRHTCL